MLNVMVGWMEEQRAAKALSAIKATLKVRASSLLSARRWDSAQRRNPRALSTPKHTATRLFAA